MTANIGSPVYTALAVAAGILTVTARTGAGELDRQGRQWAPFLEWSLENPTHEGTPYDLVATATFVHEASGEKHTTGMFYAGGDIWKFRFTGTLPGEWTYATSSLDADLD